MTIKEMQKILEKAIKDGKGDYKVVVEWRDGGGRLRWDEEDEDVTPFFKDDENIAVF